MRVTTGWLVTVSCNDCGETRAVAVLHPSPGAAEEALGFLQAGLPTGYDLGVVSLAEALRQGLLGNSTLEHLGLLESVA